MWDFFSSSCDILFAVDILTTDELLFGGFAMCPVDFENWEGISIFAADVVPSRDELLNWFWS